MTAEEKKRDLFLWKKQQGTMLYFHRQAVETDFPELRPHCPVFGIRANSNVHSTGSFLGSGALFVGYNRFFLV